MTEVPSKADASTKHGSSPSSIEDAVQELLTMTNAAVKKLTEPKQWKDSYTDESSVSINRVQEESELQNLHAQNEQYQAERPLLDILSETPQSDEEDHEIDPVLPKQEGKTVDIMNVLGELPRSDVSILEVGGVQRDSTLSSLSTTPHLSQETPESNPEKIPPKPKHDLKEVVGLLPGDSILSPIAFQLGADDQHIHEESFTIPATEVESNGQKTLTSSVKSKSSPQDLSGDSSTASEVLKQSTRAPKIPDSARVSVPAIGGEKAVDESALNKVDPMQNTSQQMEPTTKIIIRKSNHVPQTQSAIMPGQKPIKKSAQRVRIPKKKLREVKSPHETLALAAHAKMSFQPPQINTLAQGVQIDAEDKENKVLDSDLKIIKSSKDAAKKRLLEAKGSGMNQTKRVVQAKIVEGKAAQRRLANDGMSSVMMSAFASAAPMLQVKQDLESQVKRLTEKLDDLEKQKRLEEANKHQERATDLEHKLEELTTQRLKSLEQLQEQQAAWQTHFLKVIGNMQNVQKKLSSGKRGNQQATGRSVRFGGVYDSPDALSTPAPRTQAPHPISSKPKGTSPGNAYLLKNILEQMDVSTPGPSPSLLKPARDPLTDLTPVRGPVEPVRQGSKNMINMTSTPQAESDAKSAMIRARKEAEIEAERIDIMRRFPQSLSVYMVQDPGPPGDVTKVLPERGPPSPIKGPTVPNTLDALWKDLEELQTRRKLLDENLAAVERGRGGENIAAKVDYEILLQHPEADPALVEKLRIKNMVDEQIKNLKSQIKDESSRGVSSPVKTNIPKGSRRGRLPPARRGAKVDTGLRKKQPFQTKEKSKPFTAKPAPRARSYSPHPTSAACPDTEEFVTHVYGRADYHPRRSTVHNPYIHIRTPVKQPTFRKKQAVEVVRANFIKSAKTQTTPPGTSQQSQYYFSPSTSPVHPPMSVSPTPGQLIPMAVPLGAPKISDGSETVPVLIHQTDPRYTTYTTSYPERRDIRVYQPATDRSKKPNTAVISIKGDDGPDLGIQRLDNIDIDTPDVSEAIKVIHPPVEDELPGSAARNVHDQDISEGTDGSLHIELRGGALSEAPIDYHGPSFPPTAPPERRLQASDIADEIDKHELEQETIRWVEQEILARILSELHPPGAQQIQDSGPVQDSVTESPSGDHGPALLNPESLQLFIDAGLPIDEATVNRLVEEELTKILREMIKRPAQVQPTRPKTPVAPPRATQAPSYQVPTPLPTPEPSPASSISGKPKPHLHTPSLTPESSMAESLPPHDPSPVSTPEPRPPTPKIQSPPKTPEEVTLVQTPEATPPSTPTPEPKDPGTPTLSQKSKSPPTTPKRVYPDPWGGAEFPLPEELHMKPKGASAMTFAPPPDAVDLVVRAVTPPPATPPDRSLSEPDTTETTSSERGESSISEGQLVISHGEVRAKMKRGQLPEIIEEIFGEEDVQRSIAMQSTLRDANELQDYEPYSDGEVRLSMRPSMISRVAGHDKPSRRRDSPPGDDPAGIYTRPRHPIPSEDDEDLSVGEVKPKTMNDRRKKFKKWREERSPIYAKGREASRPKRNDESFLPDSPLSVDDLHKRQRTPESSEPESGRTSAISEPDVDLGANVIVVTPAASMKMPNLSNTMDRVPEKETSSPPRTQNKPMDTLNSEDFQKVMASTDHSGIVKDSLEESMRRKEDTGSFFDDNNGPPSPRSAVKVSLTLPTVEPAASLSSEPLTDDVSEISTGGI